MMESRLLQLLQLPEVRTAAKTDQAEQFGRTFRTQFAGVNRRLQVLAAQASPGQRGPLEGQRLRIVEAFQKTSAQIDSVEPAKADQMMQRVLAAVQLVERNATELADGVSALRDQWLACEELLDDAVRQIGELEEVRHPKATTLRKLGDAIRNRANSRDYQSANTALDQLLPKLDTIYAQYLETMTEESESSASGGDSPREALTLLVLNAETGEAIVGAIVQIADQSHVSSSHGLATTELPPGTHSCEIIADGYESQSCTVDVLLGHNPEFLIELFQLEAVDDWIDASDVDYSHEGERVEESDDPDGLRDELADSRRFTDMWSETLNEVSNQVEELRRAMEGSEDFGMQAVRDGLATVMFSFPDLDLSQLVHAAQASDQAAYQRILQQTAGEVRLVRDLLADGPLLSTIDENPFIETNIHATVTGVLDEIVTELGLRGA